jgi:hypothetical protein
MADLKISSSSGSTTLIEDFEISAVAPQEATGLKETEFTHSDFTINYGYYKQIPEVKAAIDTRAIWTIGDGYIASPQTSVILDNIKGHGKDTFDSILENAIVIRRVAGDFFAEIIRDKATDTIINLKPLNPASVRVVADSQGIVIKYKVADGLGKYKDFQPDEIFHLTNKRTANEILGTSDIECLRDIIDSSKETFNDMRKIVHRYAVPMRHFILDTDDTTKINQFIDLVENITKRGDDLYTPKGSVEFELLAVPSNSTLNPLPWREHLQNNFYQVVGIPQILMGSSGEFTESTAKIAYLAFEQSVKNEQREIIAQVWNQLQLRIDLAFPASLKNELISDNQKDSSGGMAGQMNIQPNDVNAGSGR